MSRHSPKEIERIKRIAAKMTPSSLAQGSFAATPGSVRTCEVCGRPMTPKRYEHAEDKRTYWTCDIAEGAWAHGAQHTAEDAPENRKAPND